MEEYNRENPLFDKQLNILVQTPDREEKVHLLTLRVLNGTRQNTSKNQRERMLRIEITDTDGIYPCFLYLWCVSEEEFHDLKQQQRLLVDFHTFPMNLIELLQCCLQDNEHFIQSKEENHIQGTKAEAKIPISIDHSEEIIEHSTLSKSRSKGPIPLNYVAVLSTTNDCIFSIVETNRFKYLTHLSLSFQKADDRAVISYLSARLAQVARKNALLSSSLDTSLSTNREVSKEKEALEAQVEILQHDLEITIANERMKHQQALLDQREQATIQWQTREEELNKRMEEVTRKFEAELQNLRAQLKEKEESIQSLTQLKYQHELKIDNLNTILHDVTDKKSNATTQLISLREENKALDQKVFAMEKQVTQSQLQIETLLNEITQKDTLLSTQQDQLSKVQAHEQDIEKSCTMYRENHMRMQRKLEICVAEINKGNEIIERMAETSRNLRAKNKMKAKIIQQQEILVDEKTRQREDMAHELKVCKQDMDMQNAQLERLRQEKQDLVTKLEESNKVLESNKGMITWLNKQINDAQNLQSRRAGGHAYAGSLAARSFAQTQMAESKSNKEKLTVMRTPTKYSSAFR